MLTDPYATGVLDKEIHGRLVQNLEHYAKDAGIMPFWVWTKLSDTCGPDELDYARQFNIHRAKGLTQGLCYLRATTKADPVDHMFALAGALVRNFIRARVMTLSKVIEHINGGGVDATALLIPNFCLSKQEGGNIHQWQAQVMNDLLMQRAQEGNQTILYATSLDDIKNAYGLVTQQLVKTRFLKIEI
jgi:hypothetical protein